MFGAGGHAESCKEVFNEFGPMCIVYLKEGVLYRGTPAKFFIAIGDNKTRKRVYEENRNQEYMSFLSRHAFGFPKSMGKGCIIMPGAIIREGVTLGDFVIVNSGAILEHGCKVGSFCHIAPGAVCCGDGEIRDGAFVGANSTLRQGVKVGAWQFVKAGTVVKEDLPCCAG